MFVAVLPYSGYAYAEAFLDMKQEAWITGHVNAYRYFGGVTRILTPDNLKTGVVKNSRTETVLNKSYQEMAEHYGTAILLARPRSPKDKAFVEGSVGVVSTWILAALRNRQFLSLIELNEAIHEKLGRSSATSPSRNERAAGQLVLRRRNCSCCLFRLHRLNWKSGRWLPSNITTISA